MIEKIKRKLGGIQMKSKDYVLEEGEELLGEYTRNSNWVKVWIPLTEVENKINEIIDVINKLEVKNDETK